MGSCTGAPLQVSKSRCSGVGPPLDRGNLATCPPVLARVIAHQHAQKLARQPILVPGDGAD